jgi:hypothetical protein
VADTFYVRPDASHGGTNAGTSYANAWQGWASITWGGAGVAAGDTLYVLFDHPRTENVDIGNHGSTAGNPCIIRGDYPGAPGSFTFTGAYFVNFFRSHTTLLNLTINGGTSNCVYGSGTLAGLSFIGNTFNAAAKSALSFGAGNGTSYTDIIITGCTFTGDCRDGGTATGAINWFAAVTSAVSTITRMTITGNRFVDLIAGRSAIHLRAEDDTDAASKMIDVLISDNAFERVSGICIEVNNGFATFGNSTGIKVQRNVFRDTDEVPTTAFGGCIWLWGFTSSAAFGRPLIEDNVAYNCVGPAGLVNIFYGDYLVRRNIAYGLSTSTIDACGVLFDFGCNGATAHSNEFYDLTGKAGVSNSGCAIMVLDSQNVRAFNNLAVRCKVGIHIGAEATTQSSVVDFNTLLECSLYGIDITATADEANNTVRNNAFTASIGTAVSVRNAGGAWSNENYNAFHGFAAASGHTLGANDVTADSLLASDGRPLSGSPLIGAGLHTGYGADFDGVQRFNPPTIGAYEAPRARGTASAREART